mmetsp:Transcript_7534/g.19090  ORF Transcript_7534/g.19090 Transcript_7534/m.19090 type:complete len:240 (-) Transcript_7534:1623-2342(-)
MQEALDRLEGVEGHLRREARRAVGVPIRRPLLACQCSLQEDVVGIHLQHSELLEAIPEEPILLAVLCRLPLLALLVPGLVGLQSLAGQHLDGPVHPAVAVVQEHPLLRLRLCQRALSGPQKSSEAQRDENGVGVELDDPICLQGCFVVDDLVPELQEDRRVQDRVELTTHHAGEGAIDDVSLQGLLLGLGVQAEGLVAVDRPGIAPEQAQLALLVLHAQEANLVGVRHAHRGAEELGGV